MYRRDGFTERARVYRDVEPGAACVRSRCEKRKRRKRPPVGRLSVALKKRIVYHEISGGCVSAMFRRRDATHGRFVNNIRIKRVYPCLLE